MNSQKNNSIKSRTVVSLLTVWAFIVMSLTGMVLYVVPQGRIAYWIDWKLFGLTKNDWGNVHIVTSLLFVVVGAWHIYYNWKALTNHMRRKIQDGIQLRKELAITLIATVLLTFGALWRIPPVSYLIDLNDAIKKSWVESEEDDPPFGHAELLSLKAFCKKTNLDFNKSEATLLERGIVIKSNDDSLKEIAHYNKLSPKDIYGAIKMLQAKQFHKHSNNTNDNVIERFRGTGIGKMTITQVCEKSGARVEICLKRLTANGIHAKADDTIKGLAENVGLRPIEVMQKMLAD